MITDDEHRARIWDVLNAASFDSKVLVIDAGVDGEYYLISVSIKPPGIIAKGS
jgi:hypothetical protein